MKVKLSAGAEIDVLTKEELRATLNEWGANQFRVKDTYREINTGTTSLTGGSAIELGHPDAGYIWIVTRINLVGTIITDTLALYRNDPSAESNQITVVAPFQTLFGHHAVVIHSGEVLFMKNIDTSTHVFGANLTVMEYKVC